MILTRRNDAFITEGPKNHLVNFAVNAGIDRFVARRKGTETA
jgi:hypothetical protein